MTGEAGQGRGDSRQGGNRRVVALCVVFVGTMLGAAYASVPLYDLFCKVTGYGGTTQRVETAAVTPIDRLVTVRFDANVRGDLPWTFSPKQRSITLKVGEVAEIAYVVESRADTETVGTSTFNVTPMSSGAYFAKITCFCFTEQRLKPGERLEMPVVFYVDPAIADDAELDSVKEITLSYSFFPVKEPARPVAAAAAAKDEKDSL
jgi:cytochrome c oxidase assembly protein subunit 11